MTMIYILSWIQFARITHYTQQKYGHAKTFVFLNFYEMFCLLAYYNIPVKNYKILFLEPPLIGNGYFLSEVTYFGHTCKKSFAILYSSNKNYILGSLWFYVANFKFYPEQEDKGA